jgi:D-amino peptidase
MRNLRAEEMDPRARLLIGDKPFSMTQGIGRDEAFDAAAFIGYHAGAGNPAGIIGHTYSNVVFEARINGAPHNETGLNAMRLGAHGVPVVLVAGDDALADEVARLLPWAERVVVKRAQAALVADSLSPERARSAIGSGLRSALERIGSMEPYRVEAPVRLEVDLRLPIMADYCSVIPGVERCAARGVTATAEDAETAFRYFIAIMRMAQVPAG